MDADPVPVDLVAQTSLFVIVCLLAKFGVLFGIGGKPLFQFGVVSIDFCNIVTLVKIYFCDFLLLRKTCFRKITSFFQFFLRSRPEKKGEFSDRNITNEARFVDNVPIEKLLFFPARNTLAAVFLLLAFWGFSADFFLPGCFQYSIDCLLSQNFFNTVKITGNVL